MKINKHKGNIHAQRLRRKKRLKELPKKQDVQVELIDGNFSFYPAAYCKHHGGYLTLGLIETHRCRYRKCNGFKVIKDDVQNKSS